MTVSAARPPTAPSRVTALWWLLPATLVAGVTVFITSCAASPQAHATVRVEMPEGTGLELNGKQVVVTGSAVEGEPALGPEICGTTPLWDTETPSDGSKPEPTPQLLDDEGKLLIPMLGLEVDGQKRCVLQGLTRDISGLSVLAVDVRVNQTHVDAVELSKSQDRRVATAFISTAVALVGFWGISGLRELVGWIQSLRA